MTGALYRPLIFLAQSTNLDMRFLHFRPETTATLNTLIGGALVVLLIVGAGVAATLYVRHRRLAQQLAEGREDARLRLLVSELSLGRAEVELLRSLLGDGDTAEILDLLESRENFEGAVERLKAARPNDEVLRRIPRLRQRLEYGFSNLRNPFVDTRMLAPGIRMRCKIRLPNREVNFLTTVLGINEYQFIIRPPTAKGKPVNLGGLRELQFRVSRENDAEYEFTCPVEGQLPTGARPVRCGHTRNISRLFFRNAERVNAEIPAELYVVRQEFASERATGGLKALDSQYRFNGSIRDISIGGALVIAEGRQERLNEGDMIVFRLPAAQIRDDIVGQVMGVMLLDDGNTQIHLQFVGLKELNRLKLGKYLSRLKGDTPAPAGPGSPADTDSPRAS